MPGDTTIVEKTKAKIYSLLIDNAPFNRGLSLSMGLRKAM